MKTPFKNNKDEIKYNLINSAIAGGLVALGGIVSAGLSWETLGAGLIAGLLAALIKFKDYWSSQKSEYSRKLITFV